MKIVKAILILLLCSTACARQNDTDQTDMNSTKTQSLYVLEEVGERTRYLTALTRLVRKAGDELKMYAGGDELFFRYETQTIPKNDKSLSLRESAILRCTPERIAKKEGGSVDTYVFEVLLKALAYYRD